MLIATSNRPPLSLLYSPGRCRSEVGLDHHRTRTRLEPTTPVPEVKTGPEAKTTEPVPESKARPGFEPPVPYSSQEAATPHARSVLLLSLPENEYISIKINNGNLWNRH